MLRVIHIDEIENDDTAQIAQSKLPRDALRRFQIGLEDGLVESATAGETAGIHINGGQRLGLVNHQIAAGFQVDTASERFFDLILDTVEIEQRPIRRVMADLAGAGASEFVGKCLHTQEGLA